MKRRLQNRIAESSATLPVGFIVMTLLWWWPQHGDLWPQLGGWLTCIVTTYFLLEANAKYGILRIRSQMMSTLYLLLMAACAFLHPISTGLLCQLCLVVALYCLLHTYRNSHAEPHTFHAALAISIGSLFWAPFLWLMPVMLWCQAGYLRALNLHNLGAAVCGFLSPYIAWTTALTAQMYYAFFTTSVAEQLPAIDYFQPLFHHAQEMVAPFHGPITTFSPTLRDSLLRHPAESAAFIVIGLIGLTGFIHYLRKNYDDKIQVRMYHYCYMTLQVIVAIWIFLQPQYYYQLFPLFIAATVPAAAHFIALTHTWMTNVWVMCLGILMIAVAMINTV